MTDKQIILHYLEERIEIIRKKIDKKDSSDIKGHMCYQASLSELNNARKRIKSDLMFSRLRNRACDRGLEKEEVKTPQKTSMNRPNKYIELKRFDNLSDFRHIVAQKKSRRKLNWLNLIEEGRLTCPATGLKVAYFAYDKIVGKNGRDSFHYNFYSECGELFTIDHIHPVSKGGHPTDINNIQPMIAESNWEKSDKVGKEWGNE